MTHTAKGITDKDFELAKKIEEVVGWRPGKAGGALEGTPETRPALRLREIRRLTGLALGFRPGGDRDGARSLSFADRDAPGHHGDRQRHAGFLLGRRAVRRARGGAGAGAESSSADGADIVDVGAESTRPGHTPLTAEEEWARLAAAARGAGGRGGRAGVDRHLQGRDGAPRARAWASAVVNDVWGLQRDPDMAPYHRAKPAPPS